LGRGLPGCVGRRSVARLLPCNRSRARGSAGQGPHRRVLPPGSIPAPGGVSPGRPPRCPLRRSRWVQRFGFMAIKERSPSCSEIRAGHPAPAVPLVRVGVVSLGSTSPVAAANQRLRPYPLPGSPRSSDPRRGTRPTAAGAPPVPGCQRQQTRGCRTALAPPPRMPGSSSSPLRRGTLKCGKARLWWWDARGEPPSPAASLARGTQAGELWVMWLAVFGDWQKTPHLSLPAWGTR